MYDGVFGQLPRADSRSAFSRISRGERLTSLAAFGLRAIKELTGECLGPLQISLIGMLSIQPADEPQGTEGVVTATGEFSDNRKSFLAQCSFQRKVIQRPQDR